MCEEKRTNPDSAKHKVSVVSGGNILPDFRKEYLNFFRSPWLWVAEFSEEIPRVWLTNWQFRCFGSSALTSHSPPFPPASEPC